MSKRILARERIRLRTVNGKDISFITSLTLDSEVLKWTVNSDIADLQKLKRRSVKYFKGFIKKKPETEKIFVVEIRNDNLWKLIGYCGFSNIEEANRCASFFIAMDPNYSQRGYGTEAAKVLFSHAFGEMHLHRIQSQVMEFNTQSIKFHRKFGFIEESRCKESSFQNCRFWDKIVFRLLEPEFRLLESGWEKPHKS